MVFAPVFSVGWRLRWIRLVGGPEGALVLFVVADGVALAFGEGGGAEGEEDEEE